MLKNKQLYLRFLSFNSISFLSSNAISIHSNVIVSNTIICIHRHRICFCMGRQYVRHSIVFYFIVCKTNCKRSFHKMLYTMYDRKITSSIHIFCLYVIVCTTLSGTVCSTIVTYELNALNKTKKKKNKKEINKRVRHLTCQKQLR